MSRKRDPLKICAEYERSAQLVSDLTKKIGAALQACPITGLAHESDFPGPDTQKLWDGDKVKHHLWQAYHETTDADCYHWERRLNLGEQEEYLREADCEHCLAAWRLIEDRKAARKAFGAAKRSVRAIGRVALAAGASA